jgi:hypothetical protein
MKSFEELKSNEIAESAYLGSVTETRWKATWRRVARGASSPAWPCKLSRSKKKGPAKQRGQVGEEVGVSSILTNERNGSERQSGGSGRSRGHYQRESHHPILLVLDRIGDRRRV